MMCVRAAVQKWSWLWLATALSLAACTAPETQSMAGADRQPAPADAPRPNERWWNDRVFYEIFVRSFADSSSGPLANDGVGDIAGLIAKLDYLNDGDPATGEDLGITGIWLMPINPSPSYHGYDVTDYYDVNPDYGTKEDFRRLMAECHRRGIRVIIDLVLNHSSSEHEHFRRALAGDSQYRDWYIFVDAPPRPVELGPWGQQIWQKMNEQFYFGIFWSGMPDLNYRNPEVTAEAYRIASFWLEEMGVDGFRLDAIRHLIEDGREMSDTPATHTWLKDFQAHLKNVRDDALSVGEIWTSTEIVSEYVTDGEVDLAFEFDIAGAIVDAAQSGDRSRLDYTLNNVAMSYPENQYASFITNHDQDRVMSVLQGDAGRARLAASLLLTAPGVPFIYYGEEIGLTGAKPDERIRTPMPWSGARHGGFTRASQPWERLEKGYEVRNVASQNADPDSLLNHYRRLIHLRSVHPALLRGGYTSIDTGRDDVIAWERSTDHERLVVVANLSARPVTGFVVRDRRASEELLHAAPLADGQLRSLEARTLYVLRTVSGDEGTVDRKTSR